MNAPEDSSRLLREAGAGPPWQTRVAARSLLPPRGALSRLLRPPSGSSRLGLPLPRPGRGRARPRGRGRAAPCARGFRSPGVPLPPAACGPGRSDPRPPAAGGGRPAPAAGRRSSREPRGRPPGWRVARSTSAVPETPPRSRAVRRGERPRNSPGSRGEPSSEDFFRQGPREKLDLAWQFLGGAPRLRRDLAARALERRRRRRVRFGEFLFQVRSSLRTQSLTLLQGLSAGAGELLLDVGDRVGKALEALGVDPRGSTLFRFARLQNGGEGKKEELPQDRVGDQEGKYDVNERDVGSFDHGS